MERNNKKQNKNHWNGNKDNNIINESKGMFFGATNQKKERERTQINNIRSQKRNVTIDTKEI